MHVGVHLYRWSTVDQVQCLREALAPAVAAVRSADLCRWFWYLPFDARGPHIFAVFAPFGAPQHAFGDVSRARLELLLRERLEMWMIENPSTVSLSRAELERRHRACRGTCLNHVDEQPGLADNDTLVFFDHPASGYPFRLTAGMTDARDLWQELDGLSSWALDHVGVPAAAVRLVAAVDRELVAQSYPVGVLWRYVATTLILPLRDRLATDESAVLDALPEMVGERNAETFERLWCVARIADSPPVERALRLILRDDGRTAEQRMRLLRELIHQALGQLLQETKVQIPLVLHAWNRNLSFV